jgi:uncharacterized protein (DUF2126 family)/transglutaminase-like putative cysteine protease
MAVRVALEHKTIYRYDRPITLGPQVIRLRPAPHNRTPIHRYSLTIEPGQHFLNWQQDPHGNYLARVVVPELTRSFSVTVDLVADLEAYSPFDFFLDPSADEYPFRYEAKLRQELTPYLEIDDSTPVLLQFIETLNRSRRRTVDFLVDTNRRVSEEIKYLIRMDPGVQTPEETLTLRQGSCRDSAWLLVQTLRHLGVAARFVSGYLIQLEPDQRPMTGPQGPEKDFTDLHAWCECYIAGAGWIGLDPTSGLFASEGHIPLACTPKPGSAAPIEGVTDKAETEFSFSMRVSRVVDRPRITKPYTEKEWLDILALGNRVDAALQAGDVRLSVGGEPTFVSSRHADAPEWNTAALGGEKATLADRLLRRLFPLWGKGGFLHHGQGKWYPGEQLPRWAYSCYFRRDGGVIWRDPRWIAQTGSNYEHNVEHAERFARRLSENLGLRKSGLMPAYEDAWYYMWRERRLPSNVDVLDSRLDDPTERLRLSRIFEQGLNAKVGWVLPLGYDHGWYSGDWFLRKEHCFLMPGDSPLGYRLPIDSQPWALARERDEVFAADTFTALPPLPAELQFPLAPRAEVALRTQQRRWLPPSEADADTAVEQFDVSGRRHLQSAHQGPRSRAAQRPAATTADSFTPPAPGESALGITRTALCVEPREGCLHIFMPPLAWLPAYLELVGAIERTAQELQLPVQLEGYPPPFDPRLGEFKVTPDPGVIEVNIPPTQSWQSSVLQTEQLYDAARREDLVAEKFEIDGTHVGSGGGNHLVMGGMRPEDSPFLRRPDVLGSLLRFWHNHPSLSYLFSGRFIGPTSQAPRFDEARADSTYEIEIALKELGKAQNSNFVPPWLVDRVLRHLLIDVTGNTHRTEFCIDKLFSPDGPTGRLGLLEMRGFEMPPHERMSAVQQLLVRSLLSVFWQKPYQEELVKWGTRLHDDFMLPFYVWSDVQDVQRSLERWGYDLPLAWFQPHYEFRFPRYGELTLDDTQLEVRGALEPWNVLGEESSGSGQARYVDSSVERLQVLVHGWVEERYQLLCNQRRMPLQPTGQNGQFVAGVRYRAWRPPSCLHPTIGVHAPLHFDIFDKWSGRSLSGCTYHVVHPGGRSAEDRPVNAAAAESRRLARFEVRGHSAGPFQPLEGGASGVGVHPHFPRTLDLRRT